MKITKFAQSCILLETKGKRILVDPGNIQFEESLLDEHWKDIDILLVTHKHGDHIHVPALKRIMTEKTKFYTSQEVKDAYPEISPEIVKEGDLIELDDIKIEVTKAVHGFLPHLKGGKEINENIGFIIDDGEKRYYFTSDSICFDNDYKCDVVFVPVCNHGLVMGSFEAAAFSKKLGVSLVIPVHYDNPSYPVSLDKVREEFSKLDLNLKVLGIGESLKVLD
jgi:L-ascorbate metabolism protein UlaG (beta-lactamase superfamily)